MSFSGVYQFLHRVWYRVGAEDVLTERMNDTLTFSSVVLSRINPVVRS